MQSSKHGVILFSLGTNVLWNNLKSDIDKTFIEAFSKIPQTILWKCDRKFENLPKNVIVREWLPQSDLLGTFIVLHTHSR